MISVIVPFYNQWQLTHACLMDLYTYIPKESDIKLEVVLVDDASTDVEISGGVAWWQGINYHKVRYIKSEENRGFGYSMNLGAEMAHGDVLVLLSNDVKITGRFLEFLPKPDSTYLTGGELLTHDTGWNVIDGKVCPYVNGWLLACSADAWHTVGGFDPGFGRFDAEDIDLSLRFIQNGFTLRQLVDNSSGVRGVFRHLGGQTVYKYYPDRQEYTRVNIEYLRNKWTGKLGFLDNYNMRG